MIESISLELFGTRMPILYTERLAIRPFVPDDLDAIHQILDVDLGDFGGLSRAGRADWLDWSVRNERQLALLYQPPYGDRAVCLKDGRLIGTVGFVPTLIGHGKLPSYTSGDPDRDGWVAPEVGLYWATAPAHQRQGYASEAARALLGYGFTQLRLRRIVATTEYDNVGSMAVMRRLGMALEHNLTPGDPPWLQIVGILENDRAR